MTYGTLRYMDVRAAELVMKFAPTTEALMQSKSGQNENIRQHIEQFTFE